MEPKHVFLSYAKEDAEQVRRVHARLRKDGILLWLDDHNLLPSQNWQHAIEAAIRDSGAFVVFLSTNAVSKTGFIQKEIRTALEVTDRMPEGKMFIFPVRLNDCIVPERLQRWQWIDLFEKQGYNKLLSALLACVGAFKESADTRPEPKLDDFSHRADPILYRIFREEGRFLYVRTGRSTYAITQGHFLLLRKDLPKPYMALKESVADFRKLSKSAVELLIQAGAPWMKPECLLVNVEVRPDLEVVKLLAKDCSCYMSGSYWHLAGLFTLKPRIYITGEVTPIYFQEQNDLRMVVMPLRLSEAEKTEFATDALKPDARQISRTRA